MDEGAFEGKISVTLWRGVEESALTERIVLEWSRDSDWMSYQISWKAGRLESSYVSAKHSGEPRGSNVHAGLSQ